MSSFTVPNLLSAAAVEELRSQLEAASWDDGRLTAGWYAKAVKQNQQLSKEQALTKVLEKQVREAALSNPLFKAAARPRRLHTVRFNRYEKGMSYGRHTDDALMAGGRSDLSFTLFLSEPDSYEGGELVVEGLDSEQKYKLPAGSMIVYPSSRLHRVDAVTKGVRWAAVGWLESWVRSVEQRELLFELDTARRSLYQKYGKTDEFDLITKSLSNLLRYWAE